MSEKTIEDIDRLIHEPARLLILCNLYVVESADFTYLQNQTGLTRGNLSSHMSKLEESGLIEVEKEFVGKKPQTLLRLTDAGRQALSQYGDTMTDLLDGIATG